MSNAMFRATFALLIRIVMPLKFLFFFATLLSLSLDSISQCIVINEIMINGPGPNDGSNAPYTEEWIELYNTCDTPVDIGCYVIADGDFTVTIPASTIMAPNSYFLLGSPSSGLTLDLNWAECGCASGTGIGIFTNGNEQVLLSDADGNISDALQWGNGQFPLNATSTALGACSSLSFSFASNTGEFEILPDGGSNGCSMARACDGSMDWAEFCDTSPTPGASNGAVNPEVMFESSETTICAGQCISFQDITGITADNWEWTFEGADITSSSAQNPTEICYSTTGVYDVSLTITGACGSYTHTEVDMIEVSSGEAPTIIYSSPIPFCEGGGVFLESFAASAQWYLNGAPISGATSGNYYATEEGIYTVVVTIGSCELESEGLEVIVDQIVPVEITPSGVVTICEGSSIELTTNGNYDSYIWFLNDVVMDDVTSPSIMATEPGEYTVTVLDGTCSSVSSITEVITETSLSIDVTPTGNVHVCPGESLLLTATSGFSNYEWYLDGTLLITTTTPILSITETGEYVVMVGEGDCSATSQITNVSAGVVPNVSVQQGTQFTTCENSSEQLNATTGFTNYTWDINGNVVNGNNTANITITDEGIYTVTVFSADGCEDSFSTNVNVTTLEILEITSSTGFFSFCEGSSIILSIPDNYEGYQWFFNNAPAGNNPQITAQAEGDYYVLVTADDCSVTSAIMLVEEQALPTAQVNPVGPLAICDDQTILTVNTDASTIQWNWNGNPLIGSNTANLTITESGTYQAIVSNGLSCTALSNEVVVEFLNDLNVMIMANPATACEGEEVTLSINGEFDDYDWSNGSNSSTAVVDASGLYSVIVTDGECTATASYQLQMIPLPDVDAGADTIADCDLGVILYGSGDGQLTWTQDGTVELPQSATTPVLPEHNTIYVLTASLNGCEASDEVLVISTCEGMQIPNLFTPNGDGKNDTFEIVAKGLSQYSIKIYNRWGNLVFESTQLNDQWNGDINGSAASEGTYYYVIEATKYNGEPYDVKGLKGTLTLMR